MWKCLIVHQFLLLIIHIIGHYQGMNFKIKHLCFSKDNMTKGRLWSLPLSAWSHISNDHYLWNSLFLILVTFQINDVTSFWVVLFISSFILPWELFLFNNYETHTLGASGQLCMFAGLQAQRGHFLGFYVLTLCIQDILSRGLRPISKNGQVVGHNVHVLSAFLGFAMGIINKKLNV